MNETGTAEAELALAHLAAEIVDDLAQSRMLELAARQEETDSGQAGQYGAPLRDASGRFLPPPPDPAGAWSHTLRHHRNRGHLLENDDFLAQAYGRAAGPGRDAATAAHWGADAPEHQGGTEIPPEGLPPGVAEALYGGHAGDIAMIPPREPEAIPQRPARVPRDRFGNRRYPRRRSR